MKLRLKVLIILASMWVIISLLIIAYSRWTLVYNYEKLEKEDVTDEIERTGKTLTSLMNSLKILNTDWSQWDDAYQFMTDKNQKFIKTNLTANTFENAKINLILFFDTRGNLFFGCYYDLEAKKFTDIPTAIVNQIQKNKSQLGILRTKEGYIAISSLPILSSEGAGPSHGTIVMGYYFNNAYIEKLAEIVQLQVHFYPLPLPTDNPIIQQAYHELALGNKYVITSTRPNYIDGFTFVLGVNNNPIGLLQIEKPRTLYDEGVNTIIRYVGIVISMGIIFLISIWFLLKIFVLDRLISVSRQIVDINSESKFANRIKDMGNDEIGEMVQAVNSLMEIIELTQEQLKYRIFLRTEELEHLSKLNKNLAKEMLHQKEIEVKLLEGEKVLRHMAYYDSLTGLPNRFYFNELLQKAMNQANQHGIGIAVLFLDADKFKNINDTYGHDTGDKFLKSTAERIKRSIKEGDIAARFSGDEFIISLTHIQGRNLIDLVVNKILTNLSLPLQLNGVEIHSTFSIGVCIYPTDGASVEEIQKNADLAMYYAKKNKGNAFCYFSDIRKTHENKT